MKIKCVILAVLIALGIPFLYGCDQVRIYDRLMIHAIGIDFVDSQYQVSVHTVSVDNSQESTNFWQATGDTVLEALNDLTLQNGQKPMYSQNLVVVFGRSCAEKGLNAVMDFFVRHYDVRPNVQVFLAEDSAEEIFKVQKNEEYVLPDIVRSLANRGEYNGKVALVKVMDVVGRLYDEGDPFMPVLSAGEDSLQVIGTAVFQGEFLKDSLDMEQTQSFSLLTGKVKNCTQVIEVENEEDRYRATLYVSGIDNKINVELKNGKPVFTIKIECTADIASLDHSSQDKLGQEFYDWLSVALMQKMQREIKEVVNQTFFRNQCDAFRLGRYLMQKYPDYWKTHEATWREEMKDCTIRVEVDAQVVRIEQEITPKL